MAKAIVLVSGGLDSATVLAMALEQGLECMAVSFDYGQRHRGELECARRVCEAAGVRDHREVTIDPAPLAGSVLTGGPGEVPRPSGPGEVGEEIPPTYVPARNTIFLSMALAMAESEGASQIHIGANAVDYSGYPDCRPEYIAAFDRLASLATKAGVEGRPIRVVAPLLHLTKGEIIRAGVHLGVDYGLTSSCYDPDDREGPCGVCDACVLRAEGFKAAGAIDPLAEPCP
ncbi:MAG: 7-cyano-7-deazaguanine synthase QueC [Phycisphaerales bacterium]|jgi:7-cyano-7-deazaguanine synthase|nr:7-cyano-7-deazaguanine synthase QueC [Phycisphaerales bacterium]